MQTPSAAAPHTHLQDLPHQQSQVTTRSKSKAKAKVTDSKFCVIHVDFFTVLFIIFMTELLKPIVRFYDLCTFIYCTI